MILDTCIFDPRSLCLLVYHQKHSLNNAQTCLQRSKNCVRMWNRCECMVSGWWGFSTDVITLCQRNYMPTCSDQRCSPDKLRALYYVKSITSTHDDVLHHVIYTILPLSHFSQVYSLFSNFLNQRSFITVQNQIPHPHTPQWHSG